MVGMRSAAAGNVPASVTGLDMSPGVEPDDTGDERADLVARLGYQRQEFQRKLRDLSAA